MIEKTTHVAEGLGMLVTQYKRKPNLEAYLTTFLTQVQEIEAALFDILAILESLDTQTGEQLDLIGRIVGQPREGRDDATYLLWIKARMLVNFSNGTADDLMAIVSMLAGVGKVVKYTSEFPAAQILHVDSVLATGGEAIAALLQQARSAGVLTFFHWFETEPVFGFLEAPGDIEGFGSLWGPEMLINGNFADWTSDDPDDWVVTENPPNQEVSEVGSGELHGGSGTGSCNLYTSDGSACLFQATPCIIVGETYRITVVISAISAGILNVTEGNGGQYEESFDSVGSHSFEFEALQVYHELDLVAGTYPLNVTIDSISMVRVLDPEDRTGGTFSHVKGS